MAGVPDWTGSGRLDTLDGMRGLAALTVMVHHFFGRFAEPLLPETLYPHGNALTWLPIIAEFGKLGVLLFFMISGFVIMMTLERSTGLLDFATRRAVRLWPTMLVCASLSFVMINTSGMSEFYGYDFERSWVEYLSSILFFPPELTYRALGLPGEGNWVEGVYWTLWAEVRFYALVAAVFLVAPRGAFLWLWLGVQLVSTGLQAMMKLYGVGFDYFILRLLLQPTELAWFSLGICGYMYWTRRVSLPVLLLLPVALAAIALEPGINAQGQYDFSLASDLQLVVVYAVIFAVFGLFLRRSPLLGPLRWRPLLAVGLASYPLYLFHEMPGLVIFMLVAKSGLPAWLGPVIAAVVLIAVALLIHRLVEIPARDHFTGLLKSRARALEERLAFLRFRPAALPQPA
jgi:peptidoglycan/LPS O-acetylase OafA/YrhL